MPITDDALDALIGTADNTDEALTPLVKPDQLGGLLDQLLADERQDLWLAVALVGCFGLRSAELAALTVEEGRLYVGAQVKRNRRTMKSAKAARLVLPLEIPGRDDGARALKLYASGLVKLPKAIRTAIDYWAMAPGRHLTPEQFRNLQRRLVIAMQGANAEAGMDKSLHNPCRVMRLPGGHHPQTGNPTTDIPESVTGELFTFEQLDALLPPLPVTAAPQAALAV